MTTNLKFSMIQNEKIAITDLESKNGTDTLASAPPSVSKESKNIAIIAYVTVIGLIIAFIINSEKQSDFARYHIRQSLGLALTGLALSLVSIIPLLGWLVSFVGVFLMFFLWITGMINAINGKSVPVPLLGKKYEEWLADI